MGGACGDRWVGHVEIRWVGHWEVGGRGIGR